MISMRESQNSVHNELAAIIRFSQWEKRASRQFEAPGAGADHSMPSRDKRCKNQAQHKAKPDRLCDKAHPNKPAKCSRSADFTYDAGAGSFICPAGKLLLSQFTQLGLMWSAP
ncbi:MAG: hypothetical protein Q8N89_11290 [Azonexus sp.]|nr:hypothetical protein [Azonexus sp.]